MKSVSVRGQDQTPAPEIHSTDYMSEPWQSPAAMTRLHAGREHREAPPDLDRQDFSAVTPWETAIFRRSFPPGGRDQPAAVIPPSTIN